jgi:two-component sensor histidine kinase
MSVIHETLYRGDDLSHIDFRGYAANLVEELLRSYGATDRVALQVDMEDLFLDIDQAVPCGLIVNELASNSLKYAFPQDRRGQLRLAARHEPGHVALTIADDGIGLPKDFDIGNSPSLGLRLVGSLVTQLRGRLEVSRDAGAAFTITFPLRTVPAPG